MSFGLEGKQIFGINCVISACTISLTISYLISVWFSKEYQAALKVQQELMQLALEEVEQYCSNNNWLNEIHIFCRRWNEKSAKDFRGVAAFSIEVRMLYQDQFVR